MWWVAVVEKCWKESRRWVGLAVAVSACTGLEVLLALGAHQRHLVLLETFASALPRPCVKYSGWSTSDTISPVRFCAEVKGKTGTSMCKNT